MSDKPLFRRAAAMIIAVLLLVAALAPATAAFPGSNGKIVFASSTTAPAAIYDIIVMDNNSFNEVNLTNSAAVNDYDPAWSPDGTKIAFTTNRDGNNEIYIMNADGTSPVNISNDLASDTTPAWSPNGLKLLFISNRDGNNEVFVMNADGTGVTQITSTTGSVTHKNPAWRPDANRIAYTSNKDTVPADGRFDEIYLANPDGTSEVRLTVTPNGVTNPYYSRYAGWSPDGSKIVFFSRRTANNKDAIYTMLDNGVVEPAQTPVQITNTPTRADAHPRWSPDGTRIVFNSCRVNYGSAPNLNSCGDGGNHEIFVMNADGSNQTRLTHALGRLDIAADWQTVAPTVIGATCTTDCYVAPNGSDANDGASAATPLKSIQLALNTVWNNGTVHFAAGDYFENSPYGWVELTLLNKSVTLLGAGSGQSIVQLPAHKTNGLLIDGSNLDIVIQGLTFTHRAAGTNAAGFNIRIGETNAAGADVTFTDVESAWATARNASMEAPGTYGTVILDNVNMHHSVQWGMAIDNTVSNLTVTDSHFDDNGRDYSPLGTGLYLAAGLKQNVLITDSTFNRNTAYNNPASGAGLWLDSVAGVTIQNIEATGNNYGVNIAASLADSSDILMENSAITGNLVYGVVISADQNRTLDGVMVRYNDLTGNAHNGVVVNRAGNGVFADTHVNRNDLSGNPTGMSFFNAAANEEADGQCNWWGAADGPSAFGPGSGVWVGDNIDFTPWLLSTNLHDPTCFIGNTITVRKVAAGGGTTEFEFDPSWSAVNFVLKDGESTTVDQLAPGNYSVSEVTPLPTGWSLQSATCDNTTTTPVETASPASITVADGDAWVCTFTNVYTPPPTNICPAPDASNLWTDIIGKGMGSPKKHKSQMKMTVPNYASVDSLYGQLVAKNVGHANYVRFILPGKNNWVQVNTITSPAAQQAGNFWYGDYIPPAKTVTGRWFLQTSGTKNHIPRAMVLYPTYESATNTYVNIWNTYDAAEAEVHWDTANGWTPTRVITESIAPPNAPTTFNVELALVDNDKDARPVWVTVEAGGVTQTQTPNNPSAGDQLNLMSFTLAGVPAGTDEITITVYSPSVALDGVEGDSAMLVGMAANYMCAPIIP